MSDPTQQASTFKSYPPDLEARALAITKKYHNDKDLQHLFLDLAKYIEEVRREGKGKPSATSSPHKKRKLDATGIPDNDTLDSIADISFSIPQRKKFKLELGGASLRATNQSTGEIECAVEWNKVDYCVCVPVPEKAQPQYNFCIFTQQFDEQILFTVPGTAIKPEAVFTKDLPISEGEAYKDVTIKMLNKRLKRKVIRPNEKDFVSQLAQAHRKGEKAVHVKAFRGSKDGFLFLLPLGMLFGFKKPLELFPFANIHSISYTSVLQRTFNLNITVYTSPPPPHTSSSSSHHHQNPSQEEEEEEQTKEIEFSMLDQADFPGIDAYIKRHNLQDASMAEERRAKRLNINNTHTHKKPGQEDGDGEGELEKAQREVEAGEAGEEDDEDEEDDENFDPGSEGESEGEGEGSESGDEEEEEAEAEEEEERGGRGLAHR